MDDRQESSAAASLGVHPGILVPATFPPFDRYVPGAGGEGFRLFQRAGEPVYANVRARLEQAGAAVVYLRGEDREACYDYVEQHLAHLMEEAELPPGQTAEWIYRLACRAMEALLADPDSSDRYARVESMVEAITQAALRDPVGHWRMLECAPLKHRTNSHSVNVAVLLTGFARSVLRVSDRKVLKEVALGGALHDLGKTRLPAAILEKPSVLTRIEFAEVKKHPRYGLDIAKPYLHKTNIARHIIAQHHENACGNGYPDGRAGESIDLFARVARVVDVFDALTSNRPYSGAVDTYSALNRMVVEMRQQFDVTILRKFIRYLSADVERQAPVAVAGDPLQAVDADSLPAILLGPPFTLEQADDEPQAPAPDDEPAEQIAEAGPPADEITHVEEFAEEVVEAEPPAEEITHVDEPVVVVVERRVEAVPLPQRPAARATERVQIVDVPDLATRLQSLQEVCDWQDGTSALMSGILQALKAATAEQPPRAAEIAQPAAPPAPVPAQPQPLPRVDAARKLFPLIWEIDEWRRTFADGTDTGAASSRMRAETLACLDALRESTVQILRGYHVAVIEHAENFDPALHTVAGRIPHTGVTPAAAHVQRVGFMHSLGDSYEVLEPALVMVRAAKRRAG
jgi:HD-GYP domain-containing protein (c-di-GMP phosphodiesterase class II)